MAQRCSYVLDRVDVIRQGAAVRQRRVGRHYTTLRAAKREVRRRGLVAASITGSCEGKGGKRTRPTWFCDRGARGKFRCTQDKALARRRLNAHKARY